MTNKYMRFLLSLGLYLISLVSYAQLNGLFNYAQDGHIYFFLTNTSRYPMTVNVAVQNFQTNESKADVITIRGMEQLAFGPNINWFWLQGEIFIVTYMNGQSVYWTCPQNDNQFIAPKVPNPPSIPAPPVINNNTRNSEKERKELEQEEKLKKGMKCAEDYDYALSQVRRILRDFKSSMFKEPLSITANAMYLRLKKQLHEWQQKMYLSRTKGERYGYRIEKAPEETAEVILQR